MSKEYIIIDFVTKQKIYAETKGKIKYQRSQRNKLQQQSNYSKIKIGDIVFYEQKKDKFLIDSIQTRKNELKRPNIVNADQVFLVFSLKHPQLNFKLLDKFLLILQKINLKIILILTKIDLVNKLEIKNLEQKISYYKKFFSILYVSAQNIQTLKPLIPILNNKVTVLAGQTGVGKSTLLNTLAFLHVKTGEISKKSNRGKHTTKNSKLFSLYNGYLADTPGFSQLHLYNIKAEDIKNFYSDFIMLSQQCFFNHKCLHINENKCKIKEAYQKALIPKTRYLNYLAFVKETKKLKKIY
ncbi:ribosome small subunit-dependent GTPase A [Candidatus Phytoplasma melaleucae]|uniref:Small ribosomal subunit biogenesis GTPase RsgA n=1 Tax=Candidatus Phytoplasma melaleucae TaxID=2982630 RepID=A0ABT9DEK3_9MOLU|nr:ribosome small subunit-dependent GTPase A ['Melaleuca sp.' phytoplasma]MDO8168233.1 ribosome small subunit-dependent GTPase A ['Melaleuca sp.' phytoplasma]